MARPAASNNLFGGVGNFSTSGFNTAGLGGNAGANLNSTFGAVTTVTGGFGQPGQSNSAFGAALGGGMSIGGGAISQSGTGNPKYQAVSVCDDLMFQVSIKIR